VAPRLQTPVTFTVPERAAFTFTATASDSNLPAQALRFSLGAGAPAGAAIDPVTGAFTWTPTEAQGPVDAAIVVRVFDDGTPPLGDSATVTVHVSEVNEPPVIAGVPAAATMPELAPYTFTATATDADLPANTLTYSLVGAPAGAGIDGTTGVFTWTPTEAQGPGSYPFAVRVSDGLDHADAAITLTVAEVNTAPALAGVPANAAIPEQAPFTFTATATDADLPAQPLAFSLVGAPAGAAIDGTTGVFTWTPTEAQGPGHYSFTVRVSDGVANGDAAIAIDVTEGNAPPVLANIPASATIPEQALYTFTASATDADLPGQTLRFSLVAGAPAGAAIDSTSGVFTWTPSEAQGPGDYVVTVHVQDDGAPALGASAAVSLHVSEVNVPPVVTGVPGSATIEELVPYTFTASASDADLPVQSVAFSLVAAPAGAAIDSVTGVFTWTPTEAQGPGSYAFAVRASDGVGQTDVPITVTVSEVTVAAIADLSASRQNSGNDADGTTRIRLAWTATPPGTSVEVYRAPFGGYPRYDEAGGAVPAVPAYPPAAPWVLTPVTAPGGTDEPAARDFYYYVAFVHGAGLNVSAASARTSGTLDYQLGDVSDGTTAGVGDNHVTLADLSLLGAHYGISGANVLPFDYLDVGPTSDLSTSGRPMTDRRLDFEDLVLFARNFDVPSAPPLSGTTPAATNAIDVRVPAQAVVGQPLVASVHFSGTGNVRAVSLALTWDPAVVRPTGTEAGAMLGGPAGVLFSPAPGAIDVAILGGESPGLVGEGELGTITFEVLAAGDPHIGTGQVLARDLQNQPVTVTATTDVRPGTPEHTAFSLPVPNPFRSSAVVELALARGGAVRVDVFAVDGRRVRTLADRPYEPGIHRLVWDGRDDDGRALGAGVYFVRAQADRQKFTRRVTLVR
jgi:hypothetical protein